MKLSDRDKELLKNCYVDVLLENKHERYGISGFFKERDPNDPMNSLFSASIEPGKPFPVGDRCVLLPFYGNQNKDITIKRHHFFADSMMMLLFFQWNVEGGEQTLEFFAICRKLNEDNLYVADICHEMYSNEALSNI